MFKPSILSHCFEFPLSVIVNGSPVCVCSNKKSLEDVVTSAFADSELSDTEVLIAVDYFYKFGYYTSEVFSIKLESLKMDVNPYKY